ncbi:MAG: hypothetical protein L3J39_12385 [Verrucomicrobiales bacterium]|nr:hypothetical protein [Verrucomicrobiales bacterium]
MKHLWLIGAFWLAYTVPVSSQSFSHSISNLGTKEEKTIVVDGMKVVFPVDQEDVIQLLLPTFAIHREARKEHAARAAKEMNEAFLELQPKFKVLVQKLLGIDELNEGFDEAVEKELARVKKVTRQWVDWSGDIREIHFWNHATVQPFVNSETGGTTFEEIRFFPESNGNTKFTLLPPFMDEFGIGLGKLRPDLKKVQAFRLDIPLFGKPGESASSVATSVMQGNLLIAEGQNKLAAQLGGNIYKEVVESLLLDQIEAQFFTKDTPKSITRGMARYYLLMNIILSERDNALQMLPQLLYFPIPENRKNAAKFLEKVATMDPLRTDDPELQDAAGRILMMSVFQSAQNTNKDKAIFVEFKKAGIVIPKGGLNREEFIAALRKTYPNINKQLSGTRAEVVKMMRDNFLKTVKKKKAPFVLPEDYQKRKIDGMTFFHPKLLSKAVDKLGPEWAQNIRDAQEVIKKRFNAPIVPSITISEKDSASLQKYGLTGNIDEMRMWAGQTALIANTGHLAIRLFAGNEVQIWFKEDLIDLMKSGVEVPDFAMNKTGDSVTFDFSFTYDVSASVGNVLEMIASYPAKFFPVVIKDVDKMAKASLDEQIAAIRKGDVLIGQLTKSKKTITPEQLTGKTTRFFSDQQAFFVVIHEVVEADLMRGTIASEYRRWFCDGLANVIAIRECDRRFGAKVGMETFASMLNEEQVKRHKAKVDLLKWAAVEAEDDSIIEAKGLSAAHYFYATKALLTATEGRDTEFIANWIAKINETNWTRTNAETVIRAYDELTGDDLLNILNLSLAMGEGDDRIEIWNQTNGGKNDRGSTKANVIFYLDDKEVWRKDEVKLSWVKGQDMVTKVEIPRIKVNRVRVEISEFHFRGGGLAEIQLFRDGKNIARGGRVEASGFWAKNKKYSPSKVVDGITSGNQKDGGYWLLPNKKAGWIVIHIAD